MLNNNSLRHDPEYQEMLAKVDEVAVNGIQHPDDTPQNSFSALALISALLYNTPFENVLLAIAKVLHDNPEMDDKVWENLKDYV